MSDNDVISESSPLAKRLLSEGFSPSRTVIHKGEALSYFTQSGNAEMVRLLIDEGVDIHWADEKDENNTAAHCAARFGRCKVLSLLRQAGDDFSTPNINGELPFMIAVQHNEGEAVELLFPYFKTYYSQKGFMGSNVLHEAAAAGDCTAIGLLVRLFDDVEMADDYGVTALCRACYESLSLEAVQMLVGMGAEVSRPSLLNYTPLHRAVMGGSEQIVEYLLEAGADKCAKNNDGETALHLASKLGAVRIAEVLLRHGEIDLEEKDELGRAPLILASINKRVSMVRLLVTAGALINAGDEFGRTALHHAAGISDQEMIRFLIDSGADIEAKDIEMQTPLLHAALKGQLEAVCALEGFGANLQAESNFTFYKPPAPHFTEEWLLKFPYRDSHYTALHLAVMSKDSRLVLFFLGRGMNIEATTSKGLTPLCLAAYKGDVRTVTILLEGSANLEAEAAGNWRPLHFAVAENHVEVAEDRLEVAKLLLEYGADPAAEDDWGRRPAALVGIDASSKPLIQLFQESEAISQAGRLGSAELVGRFVSSARAGNTSQVSKLIEQGVDVDAIDLNGERAITAAARLGHEAVVELLIQAGAGLDSQDASGGSALWWASSCGHEGIVRQILDQGAQPELADADGQTPLSAASRAGHSVVVGLLLERGCDENTVAAYSHTPPTLAAKADRIFGANRHVDWRLSFAAYRGRVPQILRLIQLGADVQGYEDHIPIIDAIRGGHTYAVGVLINHGADTNVMAASGTPLHYAASKGHASIVRLLCRGGSDINRQRHQDGISPLMTAASKGHVEATRALLELGAIWEMRDNKGETALSHAVLAGNVVVVEMLLGAGVNLECADYSGYTPLIKAVCSGNEKIARLLLTKGAMVRTVSNTNMSPLCFAVSRGHESIVQLLIKHGAQLNHLSDNRTTPLMIAAKNGYSMIAKILIEMGADTCLTDDDNRTALSHAKEMGNHQIVSLIFMASNLWHKAERTMMTMMRQDSKHLLEHQYQRLGTGDIRLLYLHPGKAGEILSLELRTVYLNSYISYEALSYEWKGEDPVIPIQCGQYYVYVAPNCKKALESLRLENVTRTLWIDAVCINQRSKMEVNEQVAMMHTIYKKAKKVLMWVGEETEFTEAAFAKFPAICQACDALDRHSSPEIFGLTLSDFDSCETAKDIIESVLLDQHVAETMKEMLTASYFTRSWILQEIIFGGERSVVVYGKQECAWETVSMALTLFLQALLLFDDRFRSCPWLDISALRAGCMVPVIWNHCAAVASTGSVSLPTLLRTITGFRASDPRDSVFAVLNLAKLGTIGIDHPTADYTLSTQEVFLRSTRFCIQHSGTAAWFLRPRSEKTIPDLPSWVPDYSTRWGFATGPFKDNINYESFINGHTVATTSRSLYIDGCLLDNVAFKISLGGVSDVFDIVQAFTLALAKLGRGLYDKYPPRRYYKHFPLRYSTDINIFVLLDTMFTTELGWMYVDMAGELQLCYPDALSFLAWKLSKDVATPDRSRQVPKSLKRQVRYWQRQCRKSKDFDNGIYSGMEDRLRDGYDLIYTTKGRFGLAREGVAEEGMSIALLDKVSQLCLLKVNSGDGQEEGWYEYVGQAYLSRLNEKARSIRDIDSKAKIQRLEIR